MLLDQHKPALVQRHPPVQEGSAAIVAKVLPSTFKSLSVLLVFCLHNGWNCWTCLNTSSDIDSAKRLFGVDEARLGLLNTVAIVAVLCVMPLASICSWPRALLFLGAALNLASPVVRYWGACSRDFNLAIVSSICGGAAFGVIGVWPPILACACFEEKRHALVVALALLSNWLGGAMAAGLTPLLTGGSEDGLLVLLWAQTFISAGLLGFTVCWIWLPQVHENASPSIGSEIRSCLHRSVALRLFSFGVLTSVALALQNAHSAVLEGVGFSEMVAGAANSVFQVAGALVGTCMGGFIVCRNRLQRTVAAFHVLASISCVGMFALTLTVANTGQTYTSVGILMLLEVLLGSSLVSLLPFVIQLSVYMARPASENFVAGVITTFGMVIGAALNQVIVSVPSIYAVSLVFLLQPVQSICFFWCERWYKIH
eukprot:TRINITY_DN33253_c0_g1_i1.p1 TRINITY_DN33253_c0_g1~~TRINITY_DN33253_c0_g1_i1.p1  ORF type:complete len:427 (-),score=29.48 TRINITY_DN33253_c0_g1_i1:136-1416(-)